MKKYSLIDDINFIKTNKILFKTYKIKFNLIKNYTKKEKTLEIGSGSGISKYFLNNVITTDQRNSSNIDLRFNVYKNKLKDKVKNILMIDVLHHLHRPCAAINNLKKSLSKDGKIIMLEPYISPASFIFYIITSFFGPREKLGIFKKIDLSTKKKGLKKKFDFVMQPQKFARTLKIKNIRYISEYFYMFSGGLSFYKVQNFVPQFIYKFLLNFDDFLNKSKNIYLKKFFATKIIIIVKN